ncbi:MAG: hypothetical protein DA330_00830 [Nitrososphaera sp.]|nr:hypothetical protein [Nitrososphaera sp.]
MTKSPIPAPKVILMGPSGTGKTHSIRTLIDAGITPFVIFTEPGMEVLSDVPVEKLHWKYIPPAATNLQSILDIATKVNKFTFEMLTKMTDADRAKYNQFLEVINTCNNFICDRDGKSYGSADSWGTNRWLVFDSLTGLGKMAMSLVVGGKPTKSMPDWGLAQDMIRKLIDYETTNMRAGFLLIAHIARERDEVTGGTYVTINTLGQKLAPELPLFFSDVILARREGDKFTWSAAETGADTKARNVPLAANLKPSFVQLIDTWKKKGGIIEETE